MVSRKRWEPEEWADTILAYGADPDVLHEYDFEPVRVKMVRNVLRLRGVNVDRMFKKVAYADTRLAFVYGVVEHIYRHGYPYVPRFIRNKFGDAYIIDPTGQYYMTDWLPGRELEVRKPRHLEQVAENLAYLHKAAAGFTSSEPIFDSKDDISTQWRRYLAKLQSYRQAILQKGIPDEFDRLFLENWNYLIEMMEDALFQLHHSPYSDVIAHARTEQQICHGSVSRQNVLIDEECLYFVDFDHCHYGPVIQDLASLLHRYMPRCEWDEDVVLGIIDKYAEVRPLSKDELHVLNVYLQFPVRPVQVIEWYYEKLRDWDMARFEDELLRSLDRDEDRDDLIDVMAEYYGIEFYDGNEAAAQVRADGNRQVLAAAKEEPLFTTAAGTTDSRQSSSQVPIAWSPESSSMALVDGEEDQEDTDRPLFKGKSARQTQKTQKRNQQLSRNKQTQERNKQARQQAKESTAAKNQPEPKQGIWVDTQHIRRPLKNNEELSED